MSTSKTNQAGDTTGKHVSFKPAHPETTDSALPTGQVAGDTSRTQQPQATSTASGSADKQKSSGQQQSGSEDGLEAKAKSWINQQQWLQNIDVNQLSKQAKDLGSKAVEQVNRLTPTQKVIGGALLVSGISWLALRSSGSSKGQSYHGATHDEDDDTWQRSDESVYRGRTTKA